MQSLFGARIVVSAETVRRSTARKISEHLSLSRENSNFASCRRFIFLDPHQFSLSRTECYLDLYHSVSLLHFIKIIHPISNILEMFSMPSRTETGMNWYFSKLSSWEQTQ